MLPMLLIWRRRARSPRFIPTDLAGRQPTLRLKNRLKLKAACASTDPNAGHSLICIQVTAHELYQKHGFRRDDAMGMQYALRLLDNKRPFAWCGAKRQSGPARTGPSGCMLNRINMRKGRLMKI